MTFFRHKLFTPRDIAAVVSLPLPVAVVVSLPLPVAAVESIAAAHVADNAALELIAAASEPIADTIVSIATAAASAIAALSPPLRVSPGLLRLPCDRRYAQVCIVYNVEN